MMWSGFFYYLLLRIPINDKALNRTGKKMYFLPVKQQSGKKEGARKELEQSLKNMQTDNFNL